MKINVLNVNVETPAGKRYRVATVDYKDDFGKVASKKLFSFGAQENAFKALSEASPGSVFEVKQEKNDKGYWEWLELKQAPPGAAQQITDASKMNNGPVRGAWQGESAEERAKKQVFIVKQSSIASAVALLSVGAKAVKVEDVIETAQKLTDFVFAERPKLDTLVDTPNDLEDVPL